MTREGWTVLALSAAIGIPTGIVLGHSARHLFGDLREQFAGAQELRHDEAPPLMRAAGLPENCAEASFEIEHYPDRITLVCTKFREMPDKKD